MASLRLEATFSPPTLTVRLADHGLLGFVNVQVILRAHDEYESYTCASIAARSEGPILAASVDVDPGWGDALEVARITACHSDRPAEVAVELLPGRDFDRYVFAVDTNHLILGEDAVDRLDAVTERRRTRYALALGDGQGSYRGVMLIGGLLLTRSLRIPGLQVTPLQNSTRGSDLPQIMNDLLSQLGFNNTVEPLQWIREYTQRRPVVAAFAPAIRGDKAIVAAETLRNIVQRTMHVLSLHRDAAAELLAGYVEADQASSGDDPLGWLETPGYRGNLLGGFISGENPRFLEARVAALSTNPQLALWLSLHRDALYEQRWDFRFVRHFNLLETIARFRFGDAKPVLDFGGKKLIGDDGKQVSTKSARGKVYALLREWSLAMPSAETNLCVPPQAACGAMSPFGLGFEMRLHTTADTQVHHLNAFAAHAR